jgi:hypothetical protein
MADPTNITDPLVALRSQGISVTEINRKGPQLALKLYSAIAGRKIRIYPDAGVVETNDGRRYGLTDELHNLQLDTETGKLGHIGEGISAGRHYDNRCTSIGLALSADELSLENTAALPATVADFFRSQPQAFDRANGTSSRRFRGATFAPVIASPSPSGRDPFGFTLGRRHF